MTVQLYCKKYCFNYDLGLAQRFAALFYKDVYVTVLVTSSHLSLMCNSKVAIY